MFKSDEARPTPNSIKLKVKYHTDAYGEQGLRAIGDCHKSNWVDLRASETVVLESGESALIPLGISVQLPSGYEAHIAPRSSTFKNFGLIQTNSIGIIDESYCGDGDIWHMPVGATQDVTIKKGDRICQFRIVESQPPLYFESVETLGNGNRGGFGSTGVD